MVECIEAKRIRQSVLTVGRNAKFRSSLTVADLCTAENVMLSEDPREDIRFTWLSLFHKPSFLPLITIRSMCTLT